MLPLILAVVLASCAPAYSTSKPNSGGATVVTGVYLATFFTEGDLGAQLTTELNKSLTGAGFKVTALRYPDPKGATIKLEGDLTTARGSEPRPTKFSKAEIRVIEFRTGATLAKYRFETSNPLEMRGPTELARDIAGLMKNDFRQLPTQ
jgi:hypothetical protein